MSIPRRNICAIWELDHSAIRTLRSLLYGSGPDNELLSSFHPHITLANYPEAPEDALIPYAEAFAARTEAFRVDFASVGLLSPQNVVCFPRLRWGLYDNFVRFHERFDADCDRWTSLAGGLYRPHVSLYAEQNGVEPETLARIQGNFSPFSGHAVALSLSLVEPHGFSILCTYPLMRAV